MMKSEDVMARRRSKPLKEAQHVRAECFLLCDFARVENGKLYIVGGGWNTIVPQHLPLSYDAYLAIKLVLPAQVILDPVRVQIELLDHNGQILGEPVFESLSGLSQMQITIDRNPPLLTEDAEESLRASGVALMGAPVRMELAGSGRFTLLLLVNGDGVASTDFTVAPVAAPSEC